MSYIFRTRAGGFDRAGSGRHRLSLFSHRLKNSASRFAPGPARGPARLIFDPLEARLLLSADILGVDLAAVLPQQQNHDVVVRMVEQTQSVQQQATAVQRVEVVDRTTAAVIASDDLSNVTQVTITGGVGDDALTIDAASFAGSEAPIFSFFGGDGADSLFLDSSNDSTWQLTGGDTGTIAGGADADFSGVETLLGGSGNDTLAGPSGDTDWLIDGAGAGRAGTTVFSGFENLLGAANNDDTFTVTETGSVAGVIDGGPGGYDSLVLDVGKSWTVVSTVTAPDSGTISYDGGQVTYRGLEPVTIAGVVADLTFDISTLSGDASDNIIRLADTGTASDGLMILDSVNGTFEDQTFSVPATSLTIRGSSGTDDITLESLDDTFSASLTVDMLSDAYDPFNEGGLLPSNGSDAYPNDSVIRVTGDLDLHGGDLDLVADTVYIGSVAEQTATAGGAWTADQTYTAVAGTGGSGTGATATIETDADGNATARLTAAGTGYQVDDEITFADPTNAAHTVTLTMKNVATSAVISTALSGDDAGHILIGEEKTNSDGTTSYAGGQSIATGPNASLIATADTAGGHKAGKIVLATSDLANRLASWPFDFTSKSAAIDIDGTTISGGSTKIVATAKDTSLSKDVPAAASSSLSTVANLVNQIPGVLISAITGIDLSVIMRGADATINVNDATIDATGSVSIKSSTKVDTIVNAIANAIGGGGLSSVTGLELAAGYGMARSTVEANLGGSTSINATESVTIQASGSVSEKTTARASSNLNSATVNPKASSVAIALAHTDLTAHATVGSGVDIVSTGGNVNVLADGKTKTNPDASTLSPVDGKAGVGVALAFEFADIKASADGTITAAGTLIDTTTNDHTFDGTDVDPTTDQIHLDGHGYSTGDLVKYTPYSVYIPPIEGVSAGTAVEGDQSASVGGLDKGSTYSVIVVDADHFQLAKEPSLAIDATGIDATSTQSLSHVSTKTFNLDAIDSSADTVTIAGHGFETGDQVRYSAGGNTPITGLADNGLYTVEKVDDSTFQLKNGAGTVVQIAQGNALGNQTFTRESDSLVGELTLARINTTTGRIDMPGHGFALNTPIEVSYQSLADDGINTIGGLTNEAKYYLYAPDANSFELRDEATNLPITLSDPAGAAIHGLAFISTVLSFNPATAVDATRGTIAVDPVLLATLSDGDAVIYGVDPDVAVTQSVAFNLDAIDATAHTITIAGNEFTNGEVVTYDAGGNTPITGLTDGATYTVVKTNDADETFQLRDSTNAIANLAQGTALGMHTFTDAVNQSSAAVNLARIDETTDRIYVANHGFTATVSDPLLVDYAPLYGGTEIGGLDDAGDGTLGVGQYNLVAVDADSFQLRDPTTGAVVQLTDPGAPGMHVIANEQLYQASRGNIGGLVQGDTEITGLETAETYYIVKSDASHIRLVDDLSQVSSVKPIDLTSTGSAAEHSLAASSNTVGIGVHASLESTNKAKAKPEIGSKFNPTKYKDILSKPDVALATIFGNASASSGKQTVQDANGNDVTKDITNDGLSAGGAVGVIVASNDVSATVGDGATAADPARLRTNANVEVLASNEQRNQLFVQSDVSKSKTKNPDGNAKAVSLALAVGYHHNDVNAIIGSHSIVDAGNTVTVDADLSFPILILPADLVLGIPQDFFNSGVSALTNLLDGTFGVSTKLMNTWVMARAKAADTTATSVSGSIAVNVFENTDKAIIRSGAQINQMVPSATWTPLASQSVSVTAETMMEFVEMAGIGKWSLSESPFGKAKYENKTASQLFSGGDVVDFFGRSGSKALGGSILVDSIHNTVQARIEGDAAVATGADGKLTVSAVEDILRVAISQSGGKSDDGAEFAFAGSGLALRQRSDIQAGLVADSNGGPTITGGDVEITATTGGTMVGIAGSIVVAGKGSSGYGASVAVNDVERKVQAFVGADPVDPQ
ncbi:MAG: LEPR-XLL domain-containing protein, partial [Rhodobiaceae bacterium]|nr:LEPR-XLL domain-containing protein [Rhodobiaceae bacterium]